MHEQTAVVVVGGSLVGLSCALFLAHQKVPVVLVERHPGSSPHPRAIGYTERTLEIFRSIGLDGKIEQVAPTFRLRRARVESLAGAMIEESAWTPRGSQITAPSFSPVSGASMAQDRLEPILRDAALSQGADIRIKTECVELTQDADGVSALLRSGKTDRMVRAEYVIAADGARSWIRESLGITRRGRGHIRTVRSVLFRAPLEQYLQAGIHQFEIEQEGFKAFLTTYNDGRWVLFFGDDEERDHDALMALIYKAIGRKDVPVEILTTGRWELGALVADVFRQGRIFLAGDAAHALPPTRGGYGVNTGIHDAHNLAWKLAAVCSGQSSPLLLDSYDPERRSVAWTRHQQIFARPDYKAEAQDRVLLDPLIDDYAMEFGQIYRSAAVLGAAADLPTAMRPDEWQGQPGTRAPHVWVTKNGERFSTLDFLGNCWTLFTPSCNWLEAAIAASRSTSLPLRAFVFGEDFLPEDADALHTLYGLGDQGACLIRPDGFIAWRCTHPEGNHATLLTRALAQVSFATAYTHPQPRQG